MDLPAVDVVDVIDLSDAPDRPIRLTGNLVDPVAAAWRQLSAAPSEVASTSREPRWGLRFYMNGALLGEASICWASGTVRVKGTISSFDRVGESSLRLRAALRDARMQETLFANLDAESDAEAAEFAQSPELWRRSRPCPHCSAATTQLLHGVDANGGLWKGHLCACRGWQCARCFAVLDQEDDCCR